MTQYQPIFNTVFIDNRGFLIYNLYSRTERRIILNDYSFGNFVCSLREKQGLTQADVARQLGVTPAAVSKWENGSSKPRVEVLFELAEILGVRPEELMAGRYIEEEHLDPESVRLINEKYEYLRRIELHNTPKTKIRRLVAALIDWNVIGFVVISSASFLLTFIESSSTSISTPSILLVLLLMLSYPVCFMLRDLIFGGRSLGKRILGLTVLDNQTGEAPKKNQLLLRNIFLFFIHIDTIIMLITGLTLGDRAAHTVVVRKKDLDLTKKVELPEQNTEMINQYASDQKERTVSGRKQTIVWICVIVAAAVLFIGVLLISINHSLNETTETEQYKLAYAYLVQSDEFKKLDIEEDKIKFTSYSSQTDSDSHKHAEISFRINFWREITVILHDEGDGWHVCKDCTGFE